MRTFVLCILLSVVQMLSAQQAMTWEDFVEHYKADETDGGGNDDELFERLYEIHANKINLNVATEEQLGELPFLTQPQIDALLRFVKYNSPLSSMGELMAVPQLDFLTRQYLMLFAYAGGVPKDDGRDVPTPARLLRGMKHELVLRGDVPFYRQAGFEPKKEGADPAFSGDRYAATLRYNLRSMNHLYVGLQAQKDAGERWWNPGVQGRYLGGPDYLGGYLMLKDIALGRRLKLQSAILGNYKLSFGLGLTVNTNFSLGKLMTLSDNIRMDKGISRHSSSSEYGYMTGGATTLALGKVRLTAFYSRRSHDATLRNDADAVTTLNTSGLHRTASEVNRRGSVVLNDWGANLHWDVGRFSLGASAVVTHSSETFAPKHNTEASLYRYYNLQGKDFGVYSLSYSYRGTRLKFVGETALSHGSTILSDNLKPLSRPTALATLNVLRWQVNSSNALTLIGRVYQTRFVSMYGNAFGENSKPQNESGVFLGWTSAMFDNLKVEAYADAMYFPWLKSGVGWSSYGYEGMLQLTYTPLQKLSFSARYRIKSKQKNSSDVQRQAGCGLLAYNTTHTARLMCDWSVVPALSLRTSANLTSCCTVAVPSRYGFAFSETARLKLLHDRLQLDLGAVLFRTDDYDARIYAYEPSLLYSFGMASYYYHGYKLLCVLKGEVARRLWLTARFAHTRYTNRAVISSGNTAIPTNHREDLQVQLRYVF